MDLGFFKLGFLRIWRTPAHWILLMVSALSSLTVAQLPSRFAEPAPRVAGLMVAIEALYAVAFAVVLIAPSSARGHLAYAAPLIGRLPEPHWRRHLAEFSGFATAWVLGNAVLLLLDLGLLGVTDGGSEMRATLVRASLIQIGPSLVVLSWARLLAALVAWEWSVILTIVLVLGWPWLMDRFSIQEEASAWHWFLVTASPPQQLSFGAADELGWVDSMKILTRGVAWGILLNLFYSSILASFSAHGPELDADQNGA